MQEISDTADGGVEKPTVEGEAVQSSPTQERFYYTYAGGTERKQYYQGQDSLQELTPWQDCLADNGAIEQTQSLLEISTGTEGVGAV